MIFIELCHNSAYCGLKAHCHKIAQSALRWCHLWWFWLFSVKLWLHYCCQRTCKPQWI